MARTKITRKCKFCGNRFIPWTGGAGFYCSRPCYHAGFSIERFWANVKKNARNCWLWTGPTDADGYGKSGKERAHRRAWRLTYGAIPPSTEILHKCDNPPCVRPEHLRNGSRQENVNDMIAKDRSPWGTRHPNAILTEANVREIRALYVRRKIGHAVLARQFGISKSAIGAILARKTWTHLK